MVNGWQKFITPLTFRRADQTILNTYVIISHISEYVESYAK